MTAFRRPKAFISYRHQERRGDETAEAYNRQHRDWVLRFAEALASWNVDVIHDGRLRKIFRPLTGGDPSEVPFVGEVSILCMQVSQAFLPIITRGYLERICGLETGSQRAHGTVTEEWDMAVALHAEHRIELAPIIREWPVSELTTPPSPIRGENSWDFRFVEAEHDEVELLGDRLQLGYDVERPPVDLLFVDWIKLYVKWVMLLRQVDPKEQAFFEPHLLKAILQGPEVPPQWPHVDDWGCDFSRPKRFLAHCVQLRDLGVLAETGPQRDLDEEMRNLAALGVRQVQVSGPRPPVDQVKEARLQAEAAQVWTNLQGAARTHVKAHQRTLAFAGPHPPEARAGLYFGPTKPDFSHRHPAEIAQMQRAVQPKGFWGRLFSKG